MIIHLTDELSFMFQYQSSSGIVTVAFQISSDLFSCCSQTQRKTGMSHDAAVVPPLYQLINVSVFSISDCNVLK